MPPCLSGICAGPCACHCLAAGGTGLEQVIAAADGAMPREGLPVVSERAVGEGRRAGLKREAGEFTRSALPTTRMSSMRYAADFLSTVANVSLCDLCLKLEIFDDPNK
jgi:hypothetical protein